MLLKILTVQRNQRIAVLRDGALVHLLHPGRHWTWIWGVTEIVEIDVTADLVPLTQLDPLPLIVAGTRIVTVRPDQAVVRKVAGRVRQVLGPGHYRVWDDGVLDEELVTIDLLAEPLPLLPSDILTPTLNAWSEATASKRTALVLHRNGEPVKVLREGRYRLWRDGPWSVHAVPMALNSLDVAAQDVMTRDQVPVRVKPAATYRVVDPMVRVSEPQGPTQAYGAVQQALREVIATRDLESLVTDRDLLTNELVARARAVLPDLGLALERVWVKDVILPGDIKALVNKVTLARKEAEAYAIKRREEVAATRQLANTAKILEKNPVLLRLKELEALGELVGKIDKVVVVGGHELTKQVLLREVQ